MLENFRSISRFQVPFSDIDMLQHANNVSYIVWAESARCTYLAEVLELPLDRSTGVILARQEFTYERPLDYRESVAVGCRVSRMGTKSFDFSYEVWSQTHRVRAAWGISAMVAYDYTTKASVAIPALWRKIVAGYEPLSPQGL